MSQQDTASRIRLELEWLWKFGRSLKTDDKPAFQDMVERLGRSELYRSLSGSLDSPVRQMPMILSLLFLHQKMLVELERRIIEDAIQGFPDST